MNAYAEQSTNYYRKSDTRRVGSCIIKVVVAALIWITKGHVHKLYPNDGEMKILIIIIEN